MKLFSKAKKDVEELKVETDRTQKSVSKMEAIVKSLKNANNYFWKPYTIEEVKKILSSHRFVSVYAQIDNKKIVFGHSIVEAAIVKNEHYFLQKKMYRTLDELFTSKDVLGFSLQDRFADLKIIIMLDNLDQQIL